MGGTIEPRKISEIEAENRELRAKLKRASSIIKRMIGKIKPLYLRNGLEELLEDIEVDCRNKKSPAKDWRDDPTYWRNNLESIGRNGY